MKNKSIKYIITTILLSTFTLQAAPPKFITPAEIQVWQERIVNGPFKTKGDYAPQGSESPGDYERILDNANNFIANTSAEIWVGIDGTLDGGTEPWVENLEGSYQSLGPGSSRGTNAMGAAFIYLLSDDLTYGNACKTFLIDQATNYPFTDFSDTSNWQLGAVKADNHPGWHICEWANRLAFTYDCVNSLMSASERATVEAWLLDIGLYFQDALDSNLELLWPNRSTGDYTPSGVVNHSSTKSSWLDGPNNIPTFWYNNRKVHSARLMARLGLLLDNSSMQASAKLWAKEVVRFAMYPNGLLGETIRSDTEYLGGGSTHIALEAGYWYPWITLSGTIMIAELFARTGDYELYEYTTSEGYEYNTSWGYGDTRGGSKSLLLGAWAMCRHYEGLFYDRENNRHGIYPYNGIVDIDELIDGRFYDPIANITRSWNHESWASPLARYTNDQYLRGAVLRVTANTDGYKDGVTLQTNQAFQGPGLGTPGTLMMYGDMQKKALPYRNHFITYLSDLDWTSSDCPHCRNQTPQKDTARDAVSPISIEGTVYERGIGAHAYSEISYNINGEYSAFISVIGVDDTKAGLGNASIVFEVWGDGNLLYESPLLTGYDDAELLHVNIEGVHTLELIINDGGNGANSDWGNWADARLIKHSATTIDYNNNIATSGNGIIGVNTTDNGSLGTILHHAGTPSNINDGDFTTKVNTWNANKDENGQYYDYVGVKWTSLVDDVAAITLHHATYADGGWFDYPNINSSLIELDTISIEPRVQYTTDNGITWQEVTNSTNNYSNAINNNTIPSNSGGFIQGAVTFEFDPVDDINGIRIFGDGAGPTASGNAAGFIGICEFEVFQIANE